MHPDEKHVAIVVLNWKGWSDTIECLESILKSQYQNYHILLVDNNSEDDSIEKIRNWARKQNAGEMKTDFPQLVFPLVDKPLPFFEIVLKKGLKLVKSLENDLPPEIPDRAILLIRNDENSGFAVANNLAIKIAEQLFENDYFWLLNNDTVIKPQTLSELVEYFNRHPEVGVGTSAIYYYSEPERIHNIGGWINWWGVAKYFNHLTRDAGRQVTFVTGCAMLIRKEIFDRIGLFSEKYFFGEEDFEFSMRLLKRKISSVCVYKSKVYHKVSVSAKKTLIHKKNLIKLALRIYTRILTMEEHLSFPVWWIWKWSMMGYAIIWMTVKYKIRLKNALKTLGLIQKYLRTCKDAQKSTYDKIYQEIGSL